MTLQVMNFAFKTMDYALNLMLLIQPGKHAALRQELGGIKVRELRERAVAAEIDSAIISKWWQVVGEKMQGAMVRDARKLQVHWNKRYIGRNPDEPFSGCMGFCDT